MSAKEIDGATIYSYLKRIHDEMKLKKQEGLVQAVVMSPKTQKMLGDYLRTGGGLVDRVLGMKIKPLGSFTPDGLCLGFKSEENADLFMNAYDEQWATGQSPQAAIIKGFSVVLKKTLAERRGQ